MDINDAKEAARDPVPEDGDNTKPPETQEKSKDGVNNKVPDPTILKTDKKADSVRSGASGGGRGSRVPRRDVRKRGRHVTTATLKRARDETGEMDKTSSTNSEEPPAKTPQGRPFTLRPEPKISTDKRPADKTKQKNAGKQDGPGGG
ncbi:hypothetical protein HPB52_001644 [Rhipicephalus sanguineus]|uniref:Uncharacterized protein n=1 Tax=Rhipicephalus sanguineus TaxID=34632 RepID=A0A9D4Q463_RHISA|nr:hypothetical protein HPB52_001644 [Rhipicephalus sanguineus]